jgi:hypothetical protein
MKIPPALPLIVSCLSGGLAGTVLGLWVHRFIPTVMTYKVTTATELANQFLPEHTVAPLDVHDQTPRQGPFVYTVELTVQGGPRLENAKVTITFPNQTVSGLTFGADELHDQNEIDCNPRTPEAVSCKLQRLIPRSNFTVTVRSNYHCVPKPDSLDLSLVPIEEYLRDRSSNSIGHDLLFWFLPGAVFSLVVTLIVWRIVNFRKRAS